MKYFYEKPNGKEKINLEKIDEYYDLKNLYRNYYGLKFCDRDIELNDLIKTVFNPNVARIGIYPRPLTFFFCMTIL